MASFRARIARAAAAGGRVVLACDYPPGTPDLARLAARDIAALAPCLCAAKLNFHALLPLGAAAVSRITAAAHRRGLQAIADVKLNDICSTNDAAAALLWGMGFDAVIANPVMGPAALARLARRARRAGRGVIALCSMSSPEARASYGMPAGRGRRLTLSDAFASWAAAAGADGAVAGATRPAAIRRIRRAAPGMPVYSPGVGAQGGSAAAALAAGADYLIVGRSLTGAADPLAAAARLGLLPAR